MTPADRWFDSAGKRKKAMHTQIINTPDIRKFTAAAARDWMEWSGAKLVDVLNEDEMPTAKLGAVGFLRAPRGATSDFIFAYDEVLVVTRGRCTIASRDAWQTAGPGDVFYLPAGTPGSFNALDDVELVYVASSPYGAVNRTIRAVLLDAAE